jgi:hypothetical protein
MFGGMLWPAKSPQKLIQIIKKKKFYYLKTARWHSGRIDFTGTTEIVGVDVEFRQQGKE